jgi:D-alanyl-D-alanine dipeptidase
LADTSNDTIRKITSAGVVTTLAGTAGVSGSTDATGAAASFRDPRGIATDSAGNVYVADSGNFTIRKIVISTRAVTTLAGTAGEIGSTDATGAAARFRDPRSVATDSAGNVYVADQENFDIRKITSDGVVTTLAGTTGQNGFTPGALPGVLTSPRCVTVFGTTLYFTSKNGVVSITNLP